MLKIIGAAIMQMHLTVQASVSKNILKNILSTQNTISLNYIDKLVLM